MPLSLKFRLEGNDGWALGLTSLLVALHLLMPRLRRLPLLPAGWGASFGGGFAAAYVFLHLLPGFEQSRQALGALLPHMTPLQDLSVYMMALAGFVIYFGIRRRADIRSEASPISSKGDFYLPLAASALTNFIIGYTMALRVDVGPAFACLFTLVMALHFAILDNKLEARYTEYFDQQGRFILSAALLLGWIASALTEPNNALLVAMLTSFLGGSILFNVFHSEIPPRGQSRYWAFALGVAVGTSLLALITVLETRH